jgi:hypothetical protein
MALISSARTLVLATIGICALSAQTVKVSWDKVDRVSNTTPTLQVVVNPPLRPGSAIHDRVYADLHNFGFDYVRYVPWLPYPKLAVAELEPPTNGKTSWDFSLIDPMTLDFLNAQKGHSLMLNFSTIPAWMWKTPKPVAYPQDPDEVSWDYTQGSELRDPSCKEVADYYARLVSWYVNGGFTDEYGKRYESGHHFKIDYWEVLNEIDFEHKMSPRLYASIYDAVVAAIHKVSPETKFVALALADPSGDPAMFEYFLNPRNHKRGTPLDMISYHFYAVPSSDETPEIQQHTFFDQADRFFVTVRYVEQIRKRLSPSTKTDTNELGVISADDLAQGTPGHVVQPIPDSYWHLAASLYAYLFGQLTELGIDVAGESQLVGYPTQFPSVSMVDWNTGAPNARYRVLGLLRNNFGPGDKVVTADSGSPYVYALGFIGRDGTRKLLLVNKRERTFDLTLPQSAKQVEAVNHITRGDPPARSFPNSNKLQLQAQEVAVVTF